MGGINRKTAYMIMATAKRWRRGGPKRGLGLLGGQRRAGRAPPSLTGQYTPIATRLHWDPNAETDLAGYRVYRGSSDASFTPSPATFVSQVADTGYVDAVSAPYFYKLTAVGVHGNEVAGRDALCRPARSAW